ncbi:uncharacterized protein LOC133725545 [Rosa rugosa]|uniref:uncharacterized protein LOC133725545 n=1 Tax=Rosa rugosa TaxID=74645 RepID=UPI002B402DD2|nr:uncharacterized protein LOC133725545 [Rosa rugosa]
MWKICNDILPSLDRLLTKHVNLESQLCVLCIGRQETTLHLCRDCPFTRAVLNSSQTLDHVCFTTETDSLSVLDWIKFCSGKLTTQHFDMLIFLLWGVWKERNSRVWEGKTKTVGDVVLLSTSRLQDYIFHNSCSISRGYRNIGVVRWKCPPFGCVKLNIDGAFDIASGTGGIGLVVRDHSGQFVVGKGRPVLGLLSAEHSELLACREALELIVDQSLQPAIVETDSLIIQQQLCKAGVNLSRLGRIYDDLGVLLDALPNVRIMHTRRDANIAAHLMAAEAVAVGQPLFYSSVPSFLCNVIDAELCNH